MKKIFTVCVLFTLIAFGFRPLAAQQAQTARNDSVRLTFDNVITGKLPQGWKIEGTNQKGPLATWKVVEDSSAPSGDKVLGMIAPNHDFGGTFNLCWTKGVKFLNGEIKVMFKANKGLEDQGGGVIWRVLDKGNYYISRYNPLENNFRIYYIKDEARKILASARVELPKGNWYELKIIQNANHITGYLNGKKLLEVDDDTFSGTGGVGLWTKADAVTSFDNFEVKTLR